MPIEDNGAGGTILTGNAIEWFRVISLKQCLSMYVKHGMKMNRNVTPQVMRGVATEYTGTVYPKSKKGLETALADIEAFLATRKPDDVQRVPVA